MEQSFIFPFLFFLGLVVGSFINVLVIRLPKGQSILGRSRCNHCITELGALDLLPVFSFIFLRGQCRYCKTKISPRYMLIELATGALFVLVASFLQLDYLLPSAWLILLLALLVSGLAITVFIIDFEHYLILDSVVFWWSGIFLAALGVFDTFYGSWNPSQSLFLHGLLGAATAFSILGFLWLVTKGRGIGLGDVKFMIPFGLALGFPNVLVGLFFSFVLGSIVALPLLIFKLKQMKSRVPFGTFLSVGLLASYVFGERILDWYLGLIGLR